MFNDHYIKIGQPPNTPIEYLLYDIVMAVHKKVHAFYEEHPDTETAGTNIELVCLITTNTFVNMLQNLVKPDITSESRLKVVTGCLQEVNRITMDLWHAFEASRAPAVSKDKAH